MNKRDVQRAFDRAAASYDAAAVLQHEVCRRMAERLAFMKHEPHYVLDAGCGTGNAFPLLRERYPKARIVALDERETTGQESNRHPLIRHLKLRPPAF